MAAIIYVDSELGSNTNTGATLEDPVETIDYAYSIIDDYGTIILRGGKEYILPNSVLSVSNGIFLETYDNDIEKATVKAGGSSSTIRAENFIDSASIITTGFKGLIFYNFSQDCIRFDLRDDDGFLQAGDSVLLERCVFKTPASNRSGLDFLIVGDVSGAAAYTFIIKNCTFDGVNGVNKSLKLRQTAATTVPPTVNIINCVYANTSQGIAADESTQEYDVDYVSLSYCWFYNNVTDFNYSVGTPTLSNNFFGAVDPLFIDPANLNYKLNSKEIGYPLESGLTDTGDPLLYDRQDGNARGNTRSDIGAYGGSLVSPPPALGPPTNLQISVEDVTETDKIFRATFSGLAGGLSYLWNFKDGATGTGKSVQHEFKNYGSYLVSCVGSNIYGEAVDIIEVGVYLYPSWYHWSFGDGDIQDWAVQDSTASHLYKETGTYKVTVSFRFYPNSSVSAKSTYVTITKKDTWVRFGDENLIDSDIDAFPQKIINTDAHEQQPLVEVSLRTLGNKVIASDIDKFPQKTIDTNYRTFP